MRRQLLRVCLISLVLSPNALAQQTVVAPIRIIDWTVAGAGAIPTRLASCAILNPGATAAQINSAIAACPANQTVQLSAGTYSLTAGITFKGTNNVTLRGAGPDATFLQFSGSDSCGGKTAMICVKSTVDQYTPESPGTAANWTSGYAKGTSTIVLDSTTNLQIGTTVVLDQLTDNGDADTGGIYVCTTQPLCTQNGSNSGYGRPNRFQEQFVTVTSIQSGACAPSCQVGITPPLFMPNWRSAKAPGAFWDSGLYVTGIGLEDFSIKYSSDPGAPFTISFFNAQNSWVKNIRSDKPIAKHVLGFMSHNLTVRDSYFFNTTNSVNDSYGIDWFQADSNLVENNIFQRIAVPLMNETNAAGNVFAYNFTLNNLFDSANTITSWMQPSAHDHGAGSNYVLYESNDGNGEGHESYFGLAHFMTDFRNRWTGYEVGSAEVNQTVAIMNQARSRFHNFVGNVLGVSGYHTTYQTIAGGSAANCVLSIYAIGLGGNCESGDGVSFPTDDPNTLPTLMRWGNYDTVNNATRFVSTEVPSGISTFPNPVPGAQTLPSSLYLSARPSWFGSVPWPAIGPDVTGGDVTGLGGHVYRIPARVCFEDVMGGTFADTSARTFNAKTCYSAGSPPPAAPTNLRIVGVVALLLPVSLFGLVPRRRR